MAQNVCVPGGELDIVAYEGNVLAFVEVRSRRLPWPSPLATVTLRKQTRLAASARRYLQMYAPTPWPPMRFDVVGVVLPPWGGEQLQLVRGAFACDRLYGGQAPRPDPRRGRGWQQLAGGYLPPSGRALP